MAEAARPRAGLALVADDLFLAAARPLLDAGGVEVVSWSYDGAWLGGPNFPDWTAAYVSHFAARGALLGHQVFGSPLSAGNEAKPRQEAWFCRLADEVRRHRYTRISEHYGFMTAGDVAFGAPLPVPMNAVALDVGRNYLARLARVSGCPVGLENLALSFSKEEALGQGAFLDALVAPVNGFLVLDVHNLFCQAHSFDVPMDVLLDNYPLDRVREVHVSGGRVHTYRGKSVRRDTHDGRVPEAVFEALRDVLPRLRHVDSVILEHVPRGLATPDQRENFCDDYRTLCDIVRSIAPRSVSATPH